ncbi:MAG: ATP-dependent zinc metalloprotease FtsH [Armatimonadaceae bacterium]
MKNFARPLLVVAAIVLTVFLVRSFYNKTPFLPFGEGPVRVELSKFEDDVKQGWVAEGAFRKDTFQGEYVPNVPAVEGGKRRFEVTVPSEISPARDRIYQLLNDNNVKYEIEPTGFSEIALNLLAQLLMLVLFLGIFWALFLRQAQGGGNQALNFARARARRLGDNVPKVTFEDVAGVDEAKQDLEEIVDFLKNARKYQQLGAKIPKGVLLLGPPGSGKTLLARAIAGEAGVPFFHISGSDFVEMFVGVGASRVRDLFETARQNRPALIFIDEIDAVGRQRGAGWGGGHDEREQTLNQLLVEMDGFDPNSGVILIAATNRPDVLDPALLRPGRFDRRVVVDAPDLKGRRKILEVHTRGKPMGDDVVLENLARRTPGFSGADLANLVNEAALLAARRGKTRIEMNDFNDSIDRVVMGPERRSRLINEREKEVIAYHELGHAIVHELLPSADPVHKVTIVSRGRALGLTWSIPTEDKYLVTRQEFLDSIAALLGGRVAEQIVFNEVTTGASNDLDRATDMARSMVTEYGMSERLGTLKIGNRTENPFLGRGSGYEDRNYSEEVARAVDEEVRAIMDQCYEVARQILIDNRDIMDRIAKVLLEKETIERDEFLRLMRGAKAAEGRTQREYPSDEPSPFGPSDDPTSGEETPGSDVPVGDDKQTPNRPPLGTPRLEPGVA